MSIYKDSRVVARFDAVNSLALSHAESINISFDVLGVNLHDPKNCDYCQSKGDHFYSEVKSNLSFLQQTSTTN